METSRNGAPKGYYNPAFICCPSRETQVNTYLLSVAFCGWPSWISLSTGCAYRFVLFGYLDQYDVYLHHGIAILRQRAPHKFHSPLALYKGTPSIVASVLVCIAKILVRHPEETPRWHVSRCALDTLLKQDVTIHQKDGIFKHGGTVEAFSPNLSSRGTLPCRQSAGPTLQRSPRTCTRPVCFQGD